MKKYSYQRRTTHWHIVDALIRARTHLSVAQIEESINHDPDTYYMEGSVLSPQLCMAAREGLVKNVGQHRCEACFTTRDHYQITDKGRVYHAERL